MARRSYGTGSLVVRADGNGRETWYGLMEHRTAAGEARLGLKRCAGHARRPDPLAGRGRAAPADGEEAVASAGARAPDRRGGRRALRRAPRERHAAQAHDDPGLPRLPAPAPRRRTSASGRSTASGRPTSSATCTTSSRRARAEDGARTTSTSSTGSSRFAVKRGWTATNPVALVDRPRSSRHATGACGSCSRRSWRRSSGPCPTTSSAPSSGPSTCAPR